MNRSQRIVRVGDPEGLDFNPEPVSMPDSRIPVSVMVSMSEFVV